VSAPLELEFTVSCSPEHAFETWAEKTTLWWPPGHSVSADPGLMVTFEPRPGGRIYERTPAGEEHEWGEVVAWNPPLELRYLWHLRQDRSDATEVQVRFRAAGEVTTVQIVHRGWERLGARAHELRQRNERGWAGLLPHYKTAAEGRPG
jgi:uncharacterized protein YndB with AHSA1/START domain